MLGNDGAASWSLTRRFYLQTRKLNDLHSCRNIHFIEWNIDVCFIPCSAVIV